MKSFYLHSALHPFPDPLRLLPGEAGNAITPPITLIYSGGHGTRKDGWGAHCEAQLPAPAGLHFVL